MDFKEIFELIHFELVIEGLGVLFGFHLLWQLFLNQGILPLISLFITSIC